MRHVGTFVLLLFQLWLSVGVFYVFKGDLEPLPQEESYKASSVVYTPGGLEPLFNFARSFVNTTLPEGFPEEFINGMMGEIYVVVSSRNEYIGATRPAMAHITGVVENIDKNTFDPAAIVNQAIKQFPGYIAAIVVGCIFLVIFPIVGLVFCICRCCCDRGGNTKDSKNHCKLWIYSTFMAIFVVFTLVGNICTYVANDRMSVALDKFSHTVSENLDDIDTFLNLVEKQVIVLGRTNFITTKEAVLASANDTQLKETLAGFIINEVSNGTLTKLQSRMDEASVAFHKVDNGIDSLSEQCVNEGCNMSDLSTTFDRFRQTHQIFTTATQGIMSNIRESLEDEINNQIGGSLNTDKIKGHLDDMQLQMEDVIQDVQDFRNDTKSGFDVQKYKTDATDLADNIMKYDKIRWGAGLGLGVSISIVVGLQLIGLIFGIFGLMFSAQSSTRERMSSTGNKIMMSSAGLVFILGPLLMVLTTMCFSIGALLERFVCQPMNDPRLQILHVVNDYLPQSTRDALGADIADILTDCRTGAAAYEAFHLERKFNISQVDVTLNQEKQRIISEFRNKLDNIDLDPNKFNTSGGNLDLDNIAKSLNEVQFQELNSKLDTLKSNLEPLRDRTRGEELLMTITRLQSALATLQKVKNSSQKWKQEIEDGLNAAGQSLNKDLLSKLVENFANSLFGILDGYVQFAKNSLQHDLGRCTPIWNLYHSIAVVSFCRYSIDAFNGFWFSLGWCLFFFVPSVIFAIVLADIFRNRNSVGEITGIEMKQKT